MASPETKSSIVLLASLPSLSRPDFLAPAITAATREARHSLRIVLFSRLFDADAISHTRNFGNVQSLLTYVYVQAAQVAQDMDKILLQIDVLLKGLNEKGILPEEIGQDCKVVFRVSGDVIAAALPQCLLEIDHRYVDPGSTETITPPEAEVADESTFPVVALGGTFDHLHPGHKILLTMAAWIASQKVIVGVTDSALLTSKSNAHLLESLESRKANVRSFLELYKPGLEYDIVTINDVYGPTGWDPNIQALVVSRETESGAKMIHDHRRAKDLPGLRTFIIDVISHVDPNITEKDLEIMRNTKMSSTFIRNWIAKREQHPEFSSSKARGQ
ncbi:hypothetical protein GYMLUDRAFT_45789 [Collybiopsis luxurians FD-317 M1]|uniref:Cytidyltransferase-like domain-containing protein n=1 Tax=Collybiopsis luxurians FD-317 M1 TaxID=944289 RepID=A0A0D0CHB7_9AGAR|nr:hypothetical protein GYMLUDRAFT_45789 [Collybiopsis luxurians FD-317 M1]